MPFYIRKSVSAGPFRFNLSKSGLGVSVGVKGLRFGTGPRGHYVHAGRGGLYYRSSKPGSGRKGQEQRHSTPPGPAPRQLPQYTERGVEMMPVSSADVLEMEDSRFTEILNELSTKQASTSMEKALGITGAVTAALGLITAGGSGLVVGGLFGLGAWLVGKWLDSFQRSDVLIYDLEPEAQSAYEALSNAFDVVAACQGKWHIDAGGTVHDIHTWKRNAGAGRIIDPRPTTFTYALPRVVKSNVTPPSIQCGKETLYFLPDFLLVVHDQKVGAVAYDRLSIRWQDSNFIEEGTVPTDTEVLYHTWKHPNKNGGPDHRFANNYQIPVCRYEAIHLTSDSGLNELLQVSRAGVAAPFAEAVAELARSNGSSALSESLPRLEAS
ncbi:DUF4236 domain-containing protein [Erythrobacteraceae bacterium E2-1 Yellow Sea]|nr:DUF4236 domain-containing protein [Erythrobacteraceae bacterium E2-1 Yellow Sea]